MLTDTEELDCFRALTTAHGVKSAHGLAELLTSQQKEIVQLKQFNRQPFGKAPQIQAGELFCDGYGCKEKISPATRTFPQRSSLKPASTSTRCRLKPLPCPLLRSLTVNGW